MNCESSLDLRKKRVDLDVGFNDRADSIPAEAAGERRTGE